MRKQAVSDHHSKEPIPADPDSLLTEIQSAQLLNLSTRTLQTWRLRGGGPRFVKAGRAVRYRRRDLLQWIEQATISSTSQEVR